MTDNRFNALSTDPRYRIPSKKQSRTAVDPRFKRLFTDEDFRKKASVDRYGRKIKPESGKKELEKLYRLDKGDKQDKLGRETGKDVVGSSEEESEEVDIEAEALVKKRDPARQGGFSESESEEESGSGEESEDEAELADETAGQEQTEDIPMGEVSRRIAVVNLDWDNIRAIDIMAVASSFVPVDGNIESVTIYPSEFGRERLEREELEGPPKEIFAKSSRDDSASESESESEASDSDDDKEIERRLQQDQVHEGEDFDTAKLRQYQLERLRYYYAVIACSNGRTAQSIYDNLDTREYLSSANFFDLRFVPDDVSFEDDSVHDECTKLPDGYKPNEFRTEALTHSKVRLTWDDDDTTRKEVQKRAFSRAEMDENDLQAYIGSESSGNESTASRKSLAEERKVKKKEAQRAKMRAALGLAEEGRKASDAAKKKGGKDEVVGDMQITFTSGLGEKDNGGAGKGVFENEPQDEESTRERYIRKERERKQKRKENMKATRSGVGPAAPDSDAEAGEDEDPGFEDPFFTDPAAAAEAEKKAKKAERKKKLDARAEKDSEAAARRAELELLMAGDQADNVRHFDMREIEKAEKEARRKHKKKSGKKDKKGAAEADAGAEKFEVETQDPRFKALFESHEFAIDPTNPRFKGTEGMKALLEEGRKKRRVGDEDLDTGDQTNAGGKKRRRGEQLQANDGVELDGLVKRLKGSKRSKV
ncbi:pre-rRNA-processing protein esf1 [Vermiconidia calcicola]|uniref:Pre-rRNA-processing protein esf1 n=1 Tax=Vermiconidia calcicola TaxID=1690605 RepID=A0ACC3N0D7_9PEZI|nr:pre-rRNA-processing protein esf1 [Vermiconidia calcicola]